MIKKAYPLALVLLAVIAHTLMLWALGSSKVSLSYDGTISYLASTGHLGAFHRAIESSENIDKARTDKYPADSTSAPEEPVLNEVLAGRWVPASSWQRFLQVEDRFPLRQISSELARYDIHPPLYFWLLHFQFLVTGPTLWAGVFLNYVLGLLLIGALYGFANHVFADRRYAAWAAVLWSVSSGVLVASAQARGYPLFALMTLLFFWQVMKMCDCDRTPSAATTALVFLTFLAGLLTHYLFAVTACVAGAYALFKLRGEPRRLAATIGVFLVSTLGAIVVHPEFHKSLFRQRASAPDLTVTDTIQRSADFAAGFSHFFGTDIGIFGPLGIITVLLWTAWLIVRKQIRLGKDQGEPEKKSPYSTDLIILTVLLIGANLVLHLASLTPEHAAGGRHFAPYWPLLACVVVWIASRSRRGTILLVVLAVLMVAASVDYTRPVYRDAALMRNLPVIRVLETADAVVVDHLARGDLPRALSYVSPDTPVYCQTQQRLLQPDVPPSLPVTERSVLISSLKWGNTAGGREQLIKALWPDAAGYWFGDLPIGSTAYGPRPSGQ